MKNVTLKDFGKKTIRIGKWDVSFADAVFFAVLTAVSVFFILNAPYGITECDESLLQFPNAQLLNGDKLFSDNWVIGNLLSVFTYLPFRLCRAVLGGTQGLLLALRYCYAAVKIAFFIYLYFRFRRYGLWAVLIGLVFSGTDFFGLKTFNYYTFTAQTMFIAGMCLFLNPKEKKSRWVLSGVFMSCAVIAQPQLAVLYIVYTLLVFAGLPKKIGRLGIYRDYPFLFSLRVWLYMFYGICACAAVFLVLCAVFFTGTDLAAVVNGIRAILRVYAENNVDSALLVKLSRYWAIYGRIPSVLFLAAFAAGIVLHRRVRGIHRIVFPVLFVLFAVMSVRMLTLPPYAYPEAIGESVSHPLLLSALGAAAYVFTEKKNRALFGFLLFSFATSLVIDCISSNTFGNQTLIGAAPALLLLREYIHEQLPNDEPDGKKRKPPRKTEKTARAGRYASVLFVFVTLIAGIEAWHYAYMGTLHETERIFFRSRAPLDTVIESGTMKGIITTKELNDRYCGMLRDVKLLREYCSEGLLVVDYDTSVYLNAELPTCTCGVRTGAGWELEEAWWQLHPDRRPDVIYIPKSTFSYMSFLNFGTAEEHVEYLKRYAEVEVTEAEEGWILRLKNWRI